MERTERVILTNLCMIRDGSRVLVEEKVGKGADGIFFPGGHVEEHEPVVDSVIREMKEETGLTIRNPKLCGIKEWINEDGSRYVVFLFRADDFSGELTADCPEGELAWIEEEKMMDLPMWEGDRLFLPDVLAGRDGIDLTLIYEGDRLVQWYRGV